MSLEQEKANIEELEIELKEGECISEEFFNEFSDSKGEDKNE